MEGAPRAPELNSEEAKLQRRKRKGGGSEGVTTFFPEGLKEELLSWLPEKRQIGQVLVTAAEGQPKAEKSAADKRGEGLSHKDLLELSGKITIEGTSLRQVYEAHQIGEQALRRLVGEYLAGGEIRQTLRHELLEHEADFERDPQLRDRAHQKPGVSTSKTLSALLKKADETVGTEDGDKLAVLRARAEFQLKEEAQRHSRHRLVNLSFLSFIAILVILIVVLLIFQP